MIVHVHVVLGNLSTLSIKFLIREIPLLGFGRTHERVARIQESYVANATSSWLESLERSLTQMKEYQV